MSGWRTEQRICFSACNRGTIGYNSNMKTVISDEQREALGQRPEGVEVEDPLTQRVYILTDVEIHRRAMQALRRQDDRAAIQAGIDDMEAGRVVPFEDVDCIIRAKLGLPPRTP